MVPLASTVTVGFDPPKLAAWLGCAFLDPGGAVVVVAPGATVVVGALFRASARRLSCWKAAAARLTAGPKVLAPSVETAIMGRIGASLGESRPTGLSRHPTATTSSLPFRRSTVSPEMGRSYSLGLVWVRLSRTIVVVQVDPKSVDRPTNTLPVESPSCVSQPSRA